MTEEIKQQEEKLPGSNDNQEQEVISVPISDSLTPTIYCDDIHIIPDFPIINLAGITRERMFERDEVKTVKDGRNIKLKYFRPAVNLAIPMEAVLSILVAFMYMMGDLPKGDAMLSKFMQDDARFSDLEFVEAVEKSVACFEKIISDVKKDKPSDETTS